MLKRAQERRTGEEPVVAKSRPVSWVSRSLSANQSPLLDSGKTYSPVNCRLGWNSDLTSTEKSVRDRSENSASSSQVWHRDDNPFPTTMKATIHLGENCNDNLVIHRNANFEALETLFDITKKLILDQKHETKRVSTIEGQFTLWMRSSLLHYKAINLSKAKVHVYSHSFLCLGKMQRHPDIMVNWERSTSIFSGVQ